MNNPKVFGPGIWFCIHLKAYEATDYESKIEFLKLMLSIRDGLKCMECRKHCTEYILSNPIQPYFFHEGPEGENLGCFIWAWEFHNTVNSRLGKPVITLTEALGLFNPDALCTEDCGDEGKEKSIKIVSRD